MDQRSSSARLAEAAGRLRAAYTSGTIPPMRDAFDPSNKVDALEVQNINLDHWTSAGRRRDGYKIGLSSAVVQAQLGVDSPAFGVLFDDMVDSTGASLLAANLLQPKAEGEIAIIMASDVTGSPVTVDQVKAASAYACAAVEVVDSRIEDWKITLSDFVADNGASARIVLSEQRCDPLTTNLYSCGMVMEINDRIVSIGAGAACLGHPFRAVAWLAEELLSQGQHLKAGDIVMTGALGPMVPITSGDRVSVSVGGVGQVGFDLR